MLPKPKHLVWHAVLIAGIVAGIVFLAVNFILTPRELEVDPSVIINYMASLVLGEGMLTDETDTTITAVAMVVHFALSIAATLVIAIVVHRWGLLVGIVGGAILGLSIYSINLYTMTLIFKWFFAINSWVFALSHVAFGAVAGGVYELLDHYDRPFLPEAAPTYTHEERIRS